jgi:hypothetical protein
MKSNKAPTNISEIRALIKAKQKYYEEAIKNNVPFDKLKAIHESINELKSLLPKK